MTTTVSGSQITFNDNTTQNTSAYGGGFAFRNRIINGGMVIDQRNAGASFNTPVGAANTYSVDRWRIRGDTEGIMTVQQVTDAPTGFTNSLKILTQTVDSSIGSTQVYAVNQLIEGYNTADFGWGTASAKTITLSFWVKSSLTGTFGGAIKNNAQNRAYPFTYTISSANTWEQKTITITGDTSGTWETTTSAGVWVNFSMGAGADRLGTAGAWVSSGVFGATGEISLISTLNATWQITGVQLEKGSTATSFDYRPYGTELSLCQRYYEVGGNNAACQTENTTDVWVSLQYKVNKRAAPTIGLTNSGKLYLRRYGTAAYAATSSAFVEGYIGTTSSQVRYNGFSGMSGGALMFTSGYDASNSTVDPFSISAEL